MGDGEAGYLIGLIRGLQDMGVTMVTIPARDLRMKCLGHPKSDKTRWHH